MTAKILKNATLKVYPGFPHGMATTNPAEINADLLGFFKGQHTQVDETVSSSKEPATARV
jgi:hypothetical protein